MRPVTDEEYKILAHGIVELDAWLSRTNGSEYESEIDRLIEKFRPLYEAEKDKPDYKNAAERVIPIPVPPKSYTPAEFFEQFTKEQWAAIKTACKTDPNLEYFFDLLRVVQVVDTSDPRTIDGVNYLVYLGLITQEDADRILASS